MQRNKFYIAILTLIVLNILVLFSLLTIFNNDRMLVDKPLISVVVTSYMINWAILLRKITKYCINIYRKRTALFMSDSSFR